MMSPWNSLNKISQENCMVKIDVNAIPQHDIKLMAMAVLDGATEFYKDPKNIAAFKEWQKKRNQKRA